jgi:hypothetical protein
MAGAGIGIGVSDPFNAGATSGSGAGDNAYPTSTATVTRQNLSSQVQVDATLGYASDYDIVNQAQGILTTVPQVGQVISEGQVVYEVSTEPVVLLYGQTPAYRNLSEDMIGPDVAALDADLVALGYVTSAELPAGTDTFSYWTQVGVEDLQVALGETVTGTLSLGQAVFLPSAARITDTSAAPLGAQAPPGQPILKATSTTRVVTVDLDASQQSKVAVGDEVTIALPNNQSTPGVVSAVGTVATSSSSSASSSGSSSSSNNDSGSGTPTITVLITPTDPTATGSLDQAPVTVAVTSATVKDVLAVPVDALVALAGGGYALEVIGANGTHHLAAVTVGLFDDAAGLVQVGGSGLSAGQHVVVPGA